MEENKQKLIEQIKNCNDIDFIEYIANFINQSISYYHPEMQK